MPYSTIFIQYKRDSFTYITVNFSFVLNYILVLQLFLSHSYHYNYRQYNTNNHNKP